MTASDEPQTGIGREDRRAPRLHFAVGSWLSFLVALSLLGCRADSRTNILLVTLDTTRADRIGAMGDEAARTPTLDRLALRGTIFERAYASVPLTLPSHTSILSGLDPTRHRVHDNGASVPDSIETIAQRLSKAGYRTAAFVAAFVLDSTFGLDRGFDHYDDEIEFTANPLEGQVPQRSGDVVTDRAIEWLHEAEDHPFFVWIHYYDAHSPREPKAPFDRMPDKYAAEIAYADAQLARVLDVVARLSGETLIVVIGDHGESLGDHDEATHGIVAYDSTLHVPLIISGPGFARGARVSRLVGTQDVAPTILAAIGETFDHEVDGVALQHADVSEVDERVSYFESRGPSISYGWAPIAGIRSGRWKYTAEPEPVELYDTVSDPGEKISVAETRAEVLVRLETAYARFRGCCVNGGRDRSGLSADVIGRLAQLGYVAAPQQFDPGEEPDPRRFVGAFGWIDGARNLANEGRLAESIQALEILSTSAPIRGAVLRRLAHVYLAAGRPLDAAQTFEELNSLAPSEEFRLGLAHALLAASDFEGALAALGDSSSAVGAPARRRALLRGRALFAQGQTQEALQIAEKVLETAPLDEEALVLASRARAEMLDRRSEIARLEAWLSAPPEARSWTGLRLTLAELYRAERRDADAVRVLEATPADARALGMLGAIAAAHANPQRAIEHYEAALKEQPALSAHRRELADLYRISGRDQEALGLYDELIAARPRDPDILLERGAIHLKSGRLSDARRDFTRSFELDPELPEACFNLGLAELQAGNESEAEKYLLRALELRPEYAKASLHLARLYRERGDPRAAEFAERAASGNGGTPTPLGNR